MEGLVHQLIGALRAPWMDLTQNIFIKINDILDMITGLFDWRDVSAVSDASL